MDGNIPVNCANNFIKAPNTPHNIKNNIGFKYFTITPNKIIRTTQVNKLFEFDNRRNYCFL